MLKTTNDRISKQKGFTIIEVLIVLAIAGLILLIVFLAVPALQRNSRNTAIKNDVQNVLGGVGEFAAANGGGLPTAISGTGTIDYAGVTPVSIKVQGSTNVATVAAAPATVIGGEIKILLGNKCNPTGPGAVVSKRSVAAFYSIETSSPTPVLQCTES